MSASFVLDPLSDCALYYYVDYDSYAALCGVQCCKLGKARVLRLGFASELGP